MRLVPYIRRSEFPTTNSLFEELFNDFPFGSTTETREKWIPSVDILEKDGNLILRAELPGMTEKQIELKLEGNTLTLKGERKMDNEEKKEQLPSGREFLWLVHPFIPTSGYCGC